MGAKQARKVIQLSNDVESGFYLDNKLVCQCEPDELDILIKALGFEYEFREDFEAEKFPEILED